VAHMVRYWSGLALDVRQVDANGRLTLKGALVLADAAPDASLPDHVWALHAHPWPWLIFGLGLVVGGGLLLGRAVR
jgi:hypothetical protein